MWVAASTLTRSCSARLVVCSTLPCTWWVTPAGLTIKPASWPTTTRFTCTSPVTRCTATSATQAEKAAPNPGKRLCT